MQQQPNFDCDRVSKLVSDTICMLCKNSVKYQSELSIKGLIGVSIDASAMFMVQISETFSALTDEEEEQSHGGTCSEDARHPIKRHIESSSRSVQPPNKILALMRSMTTITTPERSLVPVQNSIRPVRTPQSLQKPPQTCNRNLMPRFPTARPRMMLAASRMMGQKRSMNSARIANPRMAMQQRGRLAAPRGGMVSRRPNMRGQMPAVRGRPTAGARGMQPRMMRNAIQMASPRNQMQPRGIRNAIQMAPPRGNVPQSPRNQMQPRMIRNAIQMTPPSGNVPQSPQNQTRPRMAQKAIQMTPPAGNVPHSPRNQMQPRMIQNAIQMTPPTGNELQSPQSQTRPRMVQNAIQMASPAGNVSQSPRSQMQPRMIRNAIQMAPPTGNEPRSPQNQTRPRMAQNAIQMASPAGNVPQSPRNQMTPGMIRNAIQMTPPTSNVPQSPQRHAQPRMIGNAIQMTPPTTPSTNSSQVNMQLVPFQRAGLRVIRPSPSSQGINPSPQNVKSEPTSSNSCQMVPYRTPSQVRLQQPQTSVRALDPGHFRPPSVASGGGEGLQPSNQASTRPQINVKNKFSMGQAPTVFTQLVPRSSHQSYQNQTTTRPPDAMNSPIRQTNPSAGDNQNIFLQVANQRQQRPMEATIEMHQSTSSASQIQLKPMKADEVQQRPTLANQNQQKAAIDMQNIPAVANQMLLRLKLANQVQQRADNQMSMISASTNQMPLSSTVASHMQQRVTMANPTQLGPTVANQLQPRFTVSSQMQHIITSAVQMQQSPNQQRLTNQMQQKPTAPENRMHLDTKVGSSMQQRATLPDNRMQHNPVSQGSIVGSPMQQRATLPDNRMQHNPVSQGPMMGSPMQQRATLRDNRMQQNPLSPGLMVGSPMQQRATLPDNRMQHNPVSQGPMVGSPMQQRATLPDNRMQHNPVPLNQMQQTMLMDQLRRKLAQQSQIQQDQADEMQEFQRQGFQAKQKQELHQEFNCLSPSSKTELQGNRLKHMTDFHPQNFSKPDHSEQSPDSGYQTVMEPEQHSQLWFNASQGSQMLPTNPDCLFQQRQNSGHQMSLQNAGKEIPKNSNSNHQIQVNQFPQILSRSEVSVTKEAGHLASSMRTSCAQIFQSPTEKQTSNYSSSSSSGISLADRPIQSHQIGSSPPPQYSVLQKISEQALNCLSEESNNSQQNVVRLSASQSQAAVTPSHQQRPIVMIHKPSSGVKSVLTIPSQPQPVPMSHQPLQMNQHSPQTPLKFQLIPAGVTNHQPQITAATVTHQLQHFDMKLSKPAVVTTGASHQTQPPSIVSIHLKPSTAASYQPPSFAVSRLLSTSVCQSHPIPGSHMLSTSFSCLPLTAAGHLPSSMGHLPSTAATHQSSSLSHLPLTASGHILSSVGYNLPSTAASRQSLSMSHLLLTAAGPLPSSMGHLPSTAASRQSLSMGHLLLTAAGPLPSSMGLLPSTAASRQSLSMSHLLLKAAGPLPSTMGHLPSTAASRESSTMSHLQLTTAGHMPSNLDHLPSTAASQQPSNMSSLPLTAASQLPSNHPPSTATSHLPSNQSHLPSTAAIHLPSANVIRSPSFNLNRVESCQAQSLGFNPKQLWKSLESIESVVAAALDSEPTPAEHSKNCLQNVLVNKPLFDQGAETSGSSFSGVDEKAQDLTLKKLSASSQELGLASHVPVLAPQVMPNRSLGAQQHKTSVRLNIIEPDNAHITEVPNVDQTPQDDHDATSKNPAFANKKVCILGQKLTHSNKDDSSSQEPQEKSSECLEEVLLHSQPQFIENPPSPIRNEEENESEESTDEGSDAEDRPLLNSGISGQLLLPSVDVDLNDDDTQVYDKHEKRLKDLCSGNIVKDLMVSSQSEDDGREILASVVNREEIPGTKEVPGKIEKLATTDEGNNEDNLFDKLDSFVNMQLQLVKDGLERDKALAEEKQKETLIMFWRMTLMRRKEELMSSRWCERRLKQMMECDPKSPLAESKQASKKKGHESDSEWEPKSGRKGSKLDVSEPLRERPRSPKKTSTKKMSSNFVYDSDSLDSAEFSSDCSPPVLSGVEDFESDTDVETSRNLQQILLMSNIEPSHPCKFTRCSTMNYSSLEKLATHYTEEHTREIPFDVPQQYKKFEPKMPDRKSGNKSKSPMKGDLPCPFPNCDRVFTAIQHVAYHHQRIHKAELSTKQRNNILKKYGFSYHCEVCSRGFATKKELLKHSTQEHR